MTFLNWADDRISMVTSAKYETCAIMAAKDLQGKVIISLLVCILRILASIADLIRQHNNILMEEKHEQG